MGMGAPQTKGTDTPGTVRGGSGLEGGITTSPLCLLHLSLCLLSCATPVRWETERANTLGCGLRFKHLDLCFSSPQPCGKSNVTFGGKILFSLSIKLEVFTYFSKDFFLFQRLRTYANPGAVHGSSNDSKMLIMVFQRPDNLFWLNRVVTMDRLEFLLRHLETSTVK